jgi:AcrR family transcriptional regulator
MGMSIPYDRTGRTQQKARTRAALLAATREMVAEGLTPTVEDAAARASISRTTAYRYFTNQRALLLASNPEIEKTSLLGPNPPRDPAARLDAVIEEFTRRTVETETQLRIALRLSLEPEAGQRGKPLMRRGRAIAWIEEALSPLLGSMSKGDVRRLVYAIRSAVGIEALVWLTDVAGVSRAEAVEIMKWSAQALLRSAASGGESTASRKRGRRKA